MLKIGEFSKLSHLTVKALRFYEREGLLLPRATDPWSGYRYYETSQLAEAAQIKAYRQLDLSIDEIKAICSGAEAAEILRGKLQKLQTQQARLNSLISSLNHILEEKEMEYQVTEKVIPKTLVYYSETVLPTYGDIMQWIPSLGAHCAALNPDLQCARPAYEFCEYLDEEYRETHIRIRHNEAVTAVGREDEVIRFRELPETKVISVMHRGPYDTISKAYAFLMEYAKAKGLPCVAPMRECYIDGIWNKEDPADWLTEVQMPIG